MKLHYAGQLMVHARQFRKSHEDPHYAATIFRYEREFAIKFNAHCNFICFADKYRVSIGEPDFLVAAGEKGH